MTNDEEMMSRLLSFYRSLNEEQKRSFNEYEDYIIKEINGFAIVEVSIGSVGYNQAIEDVKEFIQYNKKPVRRNQ